MVHKGVKATPTWKQIFVLIAATCATFATSVGFAASATALPQPPASQAPASEWEMPNVRNMVLQQALKSLDEATNSAELNLLLIDSRNGQQVINQTNWLVCAQSPSAGGNISQRTKRVNLYVKRFNQTSCFS
ncbi:PASTA domain-containing protein [Mycolicibacterium hippocampi]|uniref:PASTA domain-containing protein n=1 Tax=Mycolicibacterium hippocampi TaxID=659824 RepID=UPI0035133C27